MRLVVDKRGARFPLLCARAPLAPPRLSTRLLRAQACHLYTHLLPGRVIRQGLLVADDAGDLCRATGGRGGAGPAKRGGRESGGHCFFGERFFRSGGTNSC